MFWLEQLAQLLDLSAPVEGSPVAAVVSSVATAEPEYAISKKNKLAVGGRVNESSFSLQMILP